MRHALFVTLGGLALVTAAPATFGANWGITFQTGNAWAAPDDTAFHHADGRTTRFTLKPETRAFEMPIYWSFRAGRFEAGRGWEIELIHDKVFATDLPEAIDHLEVTHGFNHLYLNRAWRHAYGLTARVGLGPALVHPSIRADGRSDTPSNPDFLDGTYWEGQQIGGWTAQAAIQKLIQLGYGIDFSLEAKLTWSEAQIEGAGGHMWMSRKAVHLLGGFRYGF